MGNKEILCTYFDEESLQFTGVAELYCIPKDEYDDGYSDEYTITKKKELEMIKEYFIKDFKGVIVCVTI